MKTANKKHFFAINSCMLAIAFLFAFILNSCEKEKFSEEEPQPQIGADPCTDPYEDKIPYHLNEGGGIILDVLTDLNHNLDEPTNDTTARFVEFNRDSILIGVPATEINY